MPHEFEADHSGGRRKEHRVDGHGSQQLCRRYTGNLSAGAAGENKNGGVLAGFPLSHGEGAGFAHFSWGGGGGGGGGPSVSSRERDFEKKRVCEEYL